MTKTVDDNFSISKNNSELVKLVEKFVLESKLEDIQDVIVTSKTEW